MKMKIRREAKLALTALAAVFILIWGINFLKGSSLFESKSTFYGVYDNWYDWREILSVDATGTFSKVGVVRTSGAVDPNDISLRPSYILSYDSTPTINGTIMWKYI